MKLKNLFVCITAALVLAACGNGTDGSGYAVKEKICDREQLNLKGNVRELIEKKNYTVFNEQGYIVEQGQIKNGNKLAQKRCEYDADNNLLKLTTSYRARLAPDEGYDLKLYDNSGRLLEEQVYEKIESQNTVVQRSSVKYRYEIDGKKETVYRNDKLIKTVEYDKYRNVISTVSYDDKGKENLLSETEYTYDRAGNMLSKISYGAHKLPPPEGFNKKYRRADKVVYTYDKNNRRISVANSVIEPVPVSETKVEMQERAGTVNTISQDSEGDAVKKGYAYEYDRHSNWVLLFKNGNIINERKILYFGEEDVNEYENEGLEEE